VQNPIQKSVESWLLRTTANYNVRNVPRVASVIGTARGRIRPENQDKAVAALFEADTPRLDFYAFIACDGVGGMEDGSRCAALAASCFLTHLVASFRVADRAFRLREAVQYANDSVAHEFQERGGTTLSAVLLTHTGVTAISVGDTRIYKHAEKSEFRQLTVDDTIDGRVAALTKQTTAAAPSPFGHHLAQFVGQRSPLEPQVLSFEVLSGGAFANGRNGLLITTDGVHRLGRDVVNALVRASTSAREVVEHLISVADWTGGVDNATAMWISLQAPSLRGPDELAGRPALQLFDAHGDFFFSETHLRSTLTQPLTLSPERLSPAPRSMYPQGTKPLRRKGAMKNPSPKANKKKKKGQARRGRSQTRDEEAKQPELDIKVTQHSE